MPPHANDFMLRLVPRLVLKVQNNDSICENLAQLFGSLVDPWTRLFKSTGFDKIWNVSLN